MVVISSIPSPLGEKGSGESDTFSIVKTGTASAREGTKRRKKEDITMRGSKDLKFITICQLYYISP
jgi:hypothetical protein